MDGQLDILWPITLWHWVAIALLLLAIEVMAGTYDLLWVGIAAGATAVFAALMPEPIGGWAGQFVFFAVVSIVLIVLGRTVFSGMRQRVSSHPGLNQRMSQTLGAHATVISAFTAGQGRVRLWDTDWSAEAADRTDYDAGTEVIVEATRGNVLTVRAVA